MRHGWLRAWSLSALLASAATSRYAFGMTADDILEDALALPAAERARLTLELSRSLEPDGEELSPDEWARAWGPVLERRLAELRSGVVEAVPWDEAIARIRADLQSR